MSHIAVLTSGGDSPGMNTAVMAIARSADMLGMSLIGIDRGYNGLLGKNPDKDFVRLSLENALDIADLAGTQLRTARCLEFKNLEVQQRAAALLRERDVRGVIVIGTEMREADYGLLKLLTVPTVVLDNNILMENVDTVVMANRELMARQVRYLYGLGYREIGYFKFRQPVNNCDERYEGYLSELSRLGLKTPEPILLEPTVDGAFEDMTYIDGETTADPGDFLLLYTDGTTEARNPVGAFFGEDGLKDAIMQQIPKGFDGILDRLLATLDTFTARNLDDDVAMVAVRYDGLRTQDGPEAAPSAK